MHVKIIVLIVLNFSDFTMYNTETDTVTVLSSATSKGSEDGKSNTANMLWQCCCWNAIVLIGYNHVVDDQFNIFLFLYLQFQLLALLSEQQLTLNLEKYMFYL